MAFVNWPFIRWAQRAGLITGTAVCAILVGSSGSGTVTYSGTGEGSVKAASSGTGTVHITGTGEGAAKVASSGTGITGSVGTGEASVLVASSGSGALLIGGTGEASVLPASSATGLTGSIGTGEGAVLVASFVNWPFIRWAQRAGLITGSVGTGEASVLVASSGSGALLIGGTGEASVLPASSATGLTGSIGTGEGAVLVASGSTGAVFTITPLPKNVAYKGQTFSAGVTPVDGLGTGPYSYAITSGVLPDGFILNTSTGVISSIGAITATPGEYPITIMVTDSTGHTALDMETIHVLIPTIIWLSDNNGLFQPLSGFPAYYSMWYSLDQGATWTEADAANRPAITIPSVNEDELGFMSSYAKRGKKVQFCMPNMGTGFMRLMTFDFATKRYSAYSSDSPVPMLQNPNFSTDIGTTFSLTTWRPNGDQLIISGRGGRDVNAALEHVWFAVLSGGVWSSLITIGSVGDAFGDYPAGPSVTMDETSGTATLMYLPVPNSNNVRLIGIRADNSLTAPIAVNMTTTGTRTPWFSAVFLGKTFYLYTRQSPPIFPSGTNPYNVSVFNTDSAANPSTISAYTVVDVDTGGFGSRFGEVLSAQLFVSADGTKLVAFWEVLDSTLTVRVNYMSYTTDGVTWTPAIIYGSSPTSGLVSEVTGASDFGSMVFGLLLFTPGRSQVNYGVASGASIPITPVAVDSGIAGLILATNYDTFHNGDQFALGVLARNNNYTAMGGDAGGGLVSTGAYVV